MSAVLLSPSVEQYEAFDAYYDDVAIVTRDIWDITQPNAIRTDLIYASMVMHYIADPANAFVNIAASCKYLLIQDLIRRDRSSDCTEFGSDGDCMRYTFRTERASSGIEAFDLESLPFEIVYFKAYTDGDDSRHFIALIKCV
jgi:hypothetical protein